AIPPNTLLYSFKLSIGKLAITKDDIYSNEAIASLPILDKTKVSLDYLYWAMQTLQLDSVGDKAVMGITLNKAKLKNLEIPLPPLPVQEKIAAVLDKADALRRKDQELLKKYDELAQAIFIDMFGDPVKNEKGWEVKRLEELGNWAAGGTPSRNNNQYFNGDIPWVSSGELNQIYISDTKEKITLDAINNSATKLIEPFSLMLGMYDTAALKSSINTISMTCNQAIAYSKIKHGNLVYVYKTLQLTKEHHKSKQRGVRQKNLNLSIIRDIEIIFPPLHLQETFAKKIELINQFRAQANAVKSEELFQSLLQRAFKAELVR